MKFGLEARHWSIVVLAIAPLQKKKRRIWVFGSRARGDHSRFSDLDLLIEGANDFENGVIPSIKHALTESSLPIKVDLVFEEEVPITFSQQILAERQRF